VEKVDPVYTDPSNLPKYTVGQKRGRLKLCHIFSLNIDLFSVVFTDARMDSDRIARQPMDWIRSDFKKKRGRPRVSWTSTIKKDLDMLGLTWEEALDLTKDRSDWRDCTARCAFTARARTMV